MTIHVNDLQRRSLGVLAEHVVRVQRERDHYLAAILEGAGVFQHEGIELTPEGLVVTVPDDPPAELPA